MIAEEYRCPLAGDAPGGEVWRGTMAEWLAVGPALAAAGRMPDRVEVADRDPEFALWTDGGQIPGGDLGVVARPLSARRRGGRRHERRVEYGSHAEAAAALSAACIQWAKGAARC